MENLNPIGNLMTDTLETVKSMLQTDTVTGEPIYTPDGITLIPVSRITFGFGGGGVEFGAKKTVTNRPYGGGTGTGVRVEPTGFLVIKEGVVRMINVTPPANTTIDRIIEMVPQVIDRVESFISKQQEEAE